MQTTYRLQVKEIGMAFLKSLKTLFAGQEVEITVKAVDPIGKKNIETQKGLLKMIRDIRQKAPVVNPDVDIRGLIDDAQYPA